MQWNRRLGAVLALAAISTFGGCDDDRPVSPQIPRGYGPVGIKIRIQRIEKIDLLLVIDNSPSMADEQAELARRIPELVATLTDDTPDPDTGKPNHAIDMHVAVITSSLGSHGTSACDPGTNAHRDDKGHLLPRAKEVSACPGGLAAASALTWTYSASGSGQFKGEAGAHDLGMASSCVVASAKEDGCGYEETWEAAYHFLADPKPYASAAVKCTFDASGDACGSNKIEVTGVDDEILKERAAFLRPDSLLAVVVLSDENDASLKPAGLNWLPWGYGQRQMQRGWASCANVPDDFEPESKAEFDTLHSMYGCFSCFENDTDPNCKRPWPTDSLNLDVDGRDLRAFGQTQRFGYNFLWGRNRYVSAFSYAQVAASDGSLGPNPIFQGGFRTKDLVLVAAIVGVPQPLVSDGAGNPKELTELDWKKIVGAVGERDPHMIESIAPRAGLPHFAGDRAIDPVHGGERDIEDGDDLQYACIGKRAVTTKTVDCQAPDAGTKNPLCSADDQPYFKAYPGLRHLRIVHDLGASGLAASICNETYGPAIASLAKKVKAALRNECVKSEITILPDGSANCLIFESMKADTFVGTRCEDIAKGLCTPGAAPCRREGSDFPPVDIVRAAQSITLPITVVDGSGYATSENVTGRAEGPNVVLVGSDKKKHVVCEALQLEGAAATRCLHDKKFGLPPESESGWCYSQDPAVLGPSCTLGTLRFGGGAEPRAGSEVFAPCSKG